MELIPNYGSITSLELVKQINIFRSKEENKSELGHNDLLKIIRDEFEEEISLGKISHTPYTHPQNRQTYPMFVLTISQAKQVLVRESKFVRKAVISCLEELEQGVKPKLPQNFIGALEALLESEKEKEKLQKQISIQSAKIEFIDRVLDADEKIDIGQCAKILELPFGRNTLFKELRERGVFFKSKNEPKQLYIDKGYFQLKEKWIERNSHDSFMIIKILVTQRGLGYLSTLFKSESSSKKLIQLS